MVRYELKKILGTAGGKVALVLMAAVVMVTFWLAGPCVKWINEQGDPETGPAAIAKLRSAKKNGQGLWMKKSCKRSFGKTNGSLPPPKPSLRITTKMILPMAGSRAFQTFVFSSTAPSPTVFVPMTTTR